MMTVPVGITARNEAANIEALLHSLRLSIERARQLLGVRYELHVLLNDNEDHTLDLLRGERDLTIWQTRGGLVEAQRALAAARKEAPFLLFTDADILVHPDTVGELTETMLTRPEVGIAYAEKYPILPVRSSLLARALYFYNLREGYQTRRNYCNGQCFAIREWRIPAPGELHWDAAADNPFLHLAAGIRVDDIFLSRDLLRRAGPGAFHCTPSGIQYRPPETLRGMFRKYQRMRLEIERLHHYFPETRPVHARWGQRRLDLERLRQAPAGEQFLYALFQAALLLCKTAYQTQRFYYSHLSSRPCPTWLPVRETKERMPE
ncbi:MAG TPA: glycosyltransferase [Bryobacteraceae bacterium]|nr:glycosyltransferase [Bryobacteraceae bacterium]